MIIGSDDVVLSVLSYLTTRPHEVKLDNGTFAQQTLMDAFPDLEALPRGLNYELDDHGPRLGIRDLSDNEGQSYYGGGKDYDWNLFVEVDGVIKGDDGQPDVYATMRTIHRMKTSLRQLLSNGARIPLSIWGENGPTQPAGAIWVRNPRPFQAADAEFAVAFSVQKILGR